MQPVHIYMYEIKKTHTLLAHDNVFLDFFLKHAIKVMVTVTMSKTENATAEKTPSIMGVLAPPIVEVPLVELSVTSTLNSVTSAELTGSVK